MTHAEMDELYELYALGALEPELSAEIEEHLNQHCAYCEQHVRAAVRFAAAMAGMAEQKQPPSRLKERILAIAEPTQRPQTKSWGMAAALLAAACAGLLVASLWLGNALSHARNELTVIRGERNQLRVALEMMSRSDTRTVQFGRSNNVPHGRVFVNPQGLVFVASRLPQLAPDRTFELWLVPRSGNPQPAGLFRPNASGDSVRISSASVDSSQTKAVAVSVEPQQGSSAPTSTPILVVSLE